VIREVRLIEAYLSADHYRTAHRVPEAIGFRSCLVTDKDHSLSLRVPCGSFVVENPSATTKDPKIGDVRHVPVE